MDKTDSQIQQDVIREIGWDTRISSTDVGVEVHDGVVTLTGTVASWAKKLAAQDAAHRVGGVQDVANDIEVLLPGTGRRTDTDIARAVRTALQWNVLVPDTRIQSTVSDGVVTLAGAVDFCSQYDDAERAVRDIEGVRMVVNEIAVVPAHPVAAADVKRAIEAVLERRAVDVAGKLRLQIDEGDVVLDGVVGTWAERAAVVGVVRGTPGVKKVDCRIRVQSGV